MDKLVEKCLLFAWEIKAIPRCPKPAWSYSDYLRLLTPQLTKAIPLIAEEIKGELEAEYKQELFLCTLWNDNIEALNRCEAEKRAKWRNFWEGYGVK